MSEQAPKGIYVYQPDPPRKDGRMFGLGGLPLTCNVKGLTRDEAEAFADALNGITWMSDRCASCGHRFAFDSDSCPQCDEPVAPPWQEPEEWPEDCGCERCKDAREVTHE